MPAPTSYHPGELAAQEARGYADDVWGGYESINSGLDDFMALFFTQLSFLSVTVLDARRRPWSTLLCGPKGQVGFIGRVKGEEDKMRFECAIAQGDPMREVLYRLRQRLGQGVRPYDDEGMPREEFVMGAVGLMLHNRRRNKLEGVIVGVERCPTEEVDGICEDDVFKFTVETSTTFGNCPKYINTRTLAPLPASDYKRRSSSVTALDVLADEPIPAEVLSIISQADLVFLGSRHSAAPPGTTYLPDPPRLGNNCRGGRPGFLRTYYDAQQRRTCVFLPDWSGNRIMQSLGNMTNDHVASLSIPIWGSGRDHPTTVLHLTCEAAVLVGQEARKYMRGLDGASLLWITGYSLVRDSLPLVALKRKAIDGGGSGGFQKLQSQFLGGVRSHATDDVQMSQKEEEEEDVVGWSPYNPPPRVLLSETAAGAKPEDDEPMSSSTSPSAHLVDVRFYSPIIAAFTWRVKVARDQRGAQAGFQFLPGQHVVMDMFESLDTRVKLYSHMAQFQGGEKDLNDDGVRSWTMSAVRQVKQSSEIERDQEVETWEFETTLRRKQRGGVTPGLFSRGLRAVEKARETKSDTQSSVEKPSLLSAPLLAVEGGLTLPASLIKSQDHVNLTYLVSGIGLTPLLAHLNHLVELRLSQDKPIAGVRVHAIIGVRSGEVGVITRLVAETLQHESLEENQLQVTLHLLVSAPSSHLEDADPEGEKAGDKATSSPCLQVYVHPLCRLDTKSLLPDGETLNDPNSLSDNDPQLYTTFRLNDQAERKAILKSDYVLLCASKPFERVAVRALSAAGVSNDRIHTESFNF